MGAFLKGSDSGRPHLHRALRNETRPNERVNGRRGSAGVWALGSEVKADRQLIRSSKCKALTKALFSSIFFTSLVLIFSFSLSLTLLPPFESKLRHSFWRLRLSLDGFAKTSVNPSWSTLIALTLQIEFYRNADILLSYLTLVFGLSVEFLWFLPKLVSCNWVSWYYETDGRGLKSARPTKTLQQGTRRSKRLNVSVK